MATPTQAQKPAPLLNKRAVRLALATKGWVQADLAKHIGKSLTAVNLAINHNLYPNVVAAIRRTLGL